MDDVADIALSAHLVEYSAGCLFIIHASTLTFQKIENKKRPKKGRNIKCSLPNSGLACRTVTRQIGYDVWNAQLCALN